MTQPVSELSRGHGWRGALVGRDREQAAMRGCLDALLSGSGRLLLVAGEAGIGKTSLVRTLIEDAEAEGATVLSSGCYDLMVTPPYGPWMELFSGLGDSMAPPPFPVGGHHQEPHRAPSQDALFQEAFDVLAREASRQPLVLVLEDLHWTDAASLEFLRYVARQISDRPILLIATYRDREIDRRHPLHATLPILVRESEASRVTLRPLEESAVRDLVSNQYALGDADEKRVVQYLMERADGNPFFIGETLRTLEDEGVITSTDRGWQVGDLDRIIVPPLVRQVIEGRLARIDASSRSLLAIASVIGEDVPLEIWQTASGASELELANTVRNAIDLDILEETTGPAALRFTHSLIREALYYDLALPQRRALHQTVGLALASHSTPNADAIAHHFLEAKDDQAARWLMIAGERAQQLYAWRTAAERFESVLPLVGSDSHYMRALGWLRYRIGLLLIYADPERGIDHLREAERIANMVEDPHLDAYAMADRGLLRCLIGDVRRGLAEMKSGVGALDHLPPIDLPPPNSNSGEAGDALAVEDIQRGAFDLIGISDEKNIRKGALVFWLAWSGRYDDAVRIGEPYSRDLLGAASGMEDSLGDTLAGLGHAYAALGRVDDALSSFARARDTYEKIDHHFKVGNTAIYELSEAVLPFRADRVMQRQWLGNQAEAE